MDVRDLVSAAENPGMAVDLNAFKFHQETFEDFTLQHVDSESLLDLWVNTVISAFQISGELGDIYKTALADASFKYPTKNYLGFFQGKPVVTACCFFAEGVVGIYWVSTLPAYRGKGLASHMLNAILTDALCEGVLVAILQVSAQGFPLYHKLGFSEY